MVDYRVHGRTDGGGDAMTEWIKEAANRASAFVAGLEGRRVAPDATALAHMQVLASQLQAESRSPLQVLDELDRYGSPATVACAGGRYFGFVTGGALPAALAANMLAAAWDQNAGMAIGSPIGAHLERVCRDWLVSLLDLPRDTEIGFVTGATMANFTGLAAARHAVLEARGWDVEQQGLFGAPPITVIVGDEVHVSLLKALSMLGLGRERIVRLPVDTQGRMLASALPRIEGPAIVCVQAGNVNTGAFDPIEEVVARLAGSGAWIHADGAFGLWARASSQLRSLACGLERVDSIATDGHKWLNVPYDSGLVFVRERKYLYAAMASNAAYLIQGEDREPNRCVPEMSRRARGVDVWAALRSLGSAGLSDLIERNCRQARRFAQSLAAAGYRVLNDVVLNQVLVSFGEPEVTRRIIAAIQQDGTCWCGGTQWQGHTAMRISVSSWATTDEDVEASISAIVRIARDHYS
jgi:glutamate/tyrosine decarboxylase-like PLP-dependent enzyme